MGLYYLLFLKAWPIKQACSLEFVTFCLQSSCRFLALDLLRLWCCLMHTLACCSTPVSCMLSCCWVTRILKQISCDHHQFAAPLMIMLITFSCSGPFDLTSWPANMFLIRVSVHSYLQNGLIINCCLYRLCTLISINDFVLLTNCLFTLFLIKSCTDLLIWSMA